MAEIRKVDIDKSIRDALDLITSAIDQDDWDPLFMLALKEARVNLTRIDNGLR